MVEIDLRNSQIFIRDGYSNAAAVNNASGYTTGATTMLIDSITGILPVGSTFTLTGDETVYEITSHGETSGNTRSITFTPGLVNATTDNEVITVLPNQIEVRIGEGNLTYDEKKPRIYRKNRGLLDSVKNGDDEPMDVTFDFVWDHIIGSTNDPPTIEEALKNNGHASTWISSSTDPCEPYAVDLVILYTPVCPDVELEQIVLADFRYDSLAHSVKDGKVTCKGSCNRTQAVATRIARVA